MKKLFDVKPYAGFLESLPSRNTRHGYENNLRKFYFYLENHSIKDPFDAKKSDIKSFLVSLFGKVKPAYLENIRASIQAFYAWAYDEDLTDRDLSQAANGLRMPKIMRSTRGLAADQVKALENSLKFDTFQEVRISSIIYLGLHCGLRVSEISNLKKEDVNLTFSDLAAPFGMLIVKNGKGMKDRAIPLSQRLYEVLHQFEQSSKVRYGLFPGPLLFPSPRDWDKPMSNNQFQQLFKKQAVKANIPTDFSLHDLRYTFATALDASGATLIEIRDLMGHTAVSVTEKYVNRPIEKAFRAHQVAFTPGPRELAKTS